MLSKDCKDCSYMQWMVGIGQGIRCSHPENQKYKPKEGPGSNQLPVILSFIPENCEYNTKLRKN